jgi:preprotein translocase SecE subunit
MESGKNTKTGLAGLMDFFTGCREELSKVSKPSRQDTIRATLVALFIVVFVSTALAIMDFLLNSLMRVVL